VAQDETPHDHGSTSNWSGRPSPKLDRPGKFRAQAVAELGRVGGQNCQQLRSQHGLSVLHPSPLVRPNAMFSRRAAALMINFR
jgi:hypothetical protein